MPPRDRDPQGFPLTTTGRRARHRRCDPPRTEPWSFRTTPTRYDWLEESIVAGGYRNRADAIDDAVMLLAGLLRREPLPSWVAIGQIRNPPSHGPKS
jgi:hypothetical protein